MATETLIWLLPLPPILAFFLIVLFTNKSKALSHTVGVGAAALSWAGSMYIFFKAVITENFNGFADSINWLPTGDTWFRIGVMIDPLGAAVLFFVSITIFMIFLYSVGYQNFGQPKGDHDKPGLPPHGATVTDEFGKVDETIGKINGKFSHLGWIPIHYFYKTFKPGDLISLPFLSLSIAVTASLLLPKIRLLIRNSLGEVYCSAFCA